MRRPSLATAAALLAVLPAAAAAPAAAAGPTGPTVAVGAAPSAVPGVRALGAAPAAATVQLDVVLAPRDPAALTAFVDAVSTPGSPLYGDFLATGEFRGRFGPTDAAVAEVRAALEDAGLRPGPTARSGLSIPVTTTVAAAEAAFGTQIERYRRADGSGAIAAARAPRVPAAIAPQVAAVVGLDTRSRPQPRGLGRVAARAGRAGSAAGAPAPAALAPGSAPPQACAEIAGVAQRYGVYTMNEIASAYDLDGFYAAGNGGAGATVALVEFEPYTPSDIQYFQDCYGTDTSITNIDVNGGPGNGPQIGEAALDIEILTALVPEAQLLVYQGPNDGSPDVYARIADDNTAQVVSTSWGSCEPFMDGNTVLAESLIFQQMAAQGQTILSAAGDDGSTDCYDPRDNPTLTQLAVDDPASQPTVTGVGGTSLVQAAFPPVEHVWNDGATTRDGAGGGGQSSNWPMPTYQSGPGVIGPDSGSQACDFVEAYCRQVPDVSALADPDTGYVIVHRGDLLLDGGTSAATPLWAAVTTLITRSPGCAASGRVGFLNPALYQLARTPLGAFNDITVGDNDYLGVNRGLFPAAPGYDMASGLGSPVSSRLQLGLCGGIAAPAVTSAASAAFTAGQAGSFTVTTSGAPAPALTVTGTLPAGLAFSDNGNGSATVAGTPAAGSAGTYTVQLTAANGLEPDGAQTLTVTVAPPPAPPAPPVVPAPPARLPQASASTRVRVAAVTPRSFELSRSGRLSIPVACPRVAGGCRVGATLSAAPNGRRAVAPVVLARGAAVTIAPGGRRAIALRLTRRGRLAVAAASRSLRLRTRLALTSSFGGGRRTTARSVVVLRLPARGLK
ncbi:protease pro-enzyme activation domain-containing protein [Conexibacter sp. JD483]|uniref:protease pro-enzyme activation domain-containing protein n=1 Tax=unclassified Conexibacter TaxID=2627773 RepID=UPI0027197857|nr:MULTISPECIES: protease pro-enzyme activation domain-containing protein [unclassified Conexibacter]MDO8189121.1 protease pro-enzyme activation domain-containing protein [Conexibacter sp. CPCC 205706]MDO8201886.1 protease pro-enzyme activation domain-containing protein [Conexibacter sp. CPCC 205762]MDR9371736.1 protease pro-enzyme activation domain-containing protein [Conexibacter sp. JD483]